MRSTAQCLVEFEKQSGSIHHAAQLQPDQALEFARTCGGINEATNENLEHFVAGVNKIVPPIDFGNINGEPNPNNGRSFHTFTVGQEYSRVVYVTVIKGYIKGWTDGDYRILARRLKQQAQLSGADEAEVTENDKDCLTFRAWWD